MKRLKREEEKERASEVRFLEREGERIRVLGGSVIRKEVRCVGKDA